MVWKRLSHPNLLPLIGVSKLATPFYTATYWMENGNVNDYLIDNPTANRPLLVSVVSFFSHVGCQSLHYQLLGIIQGLEHLHDNSVIHGDLKGVSNSLR